MYLYNPTYPIIKQTEKIQMSLYIAFIFLNKQKRVTGIFFISKSRTLGHGKLGKLELMVH